MISIRLRKGEVKYLAFFIILSVLTIGCQNSIPTAQKIIEKSIEAHGGQEEWENVKQISFDKETTLFLENGEIEIKTEQFQLFNFGRKSFGKIEWEHNGNDIMILFDEGKISKTVNDSLIDDEDDIQSATNSFWAAQYVMNKPFDLISESTILTLSEDIIYDKKPCYVVQVSYKNDADDADRWYYIVDKESFLIVANKVELSDHTSLVQNLTYDDTSGFIFNAHRKSYRLNDEGEKTYLRAEYFYTNYSVQ